MRNWQERLYLGTWQLGGDFKSFTDKEVAALLHNAWEAGIHRYDTAAVYGRGHVEEMLAAYLPADAVIVTKLPAVRKPDRNTIEHPDVYYPPVWLQQSLDDCRRRLRRDCLDVVLLHNWAVTWDKHLDHEPLRWLSSQKRLGNIRHIGLSLPDGFASTLSADALGEIDVVEAPCNRTNQWIYTELNRYSQSGCEVLLRSLFERGPRTRQERVDTILTDAWRLGASLVVGMTTPDQIRQNCTTLAGLGEQDEP